MEQDLAYSFHLGSDKNKSKLVKENVSATTSLSQEVTGKLIITLIKHVHLKMTLLVKL